MIDWLWELLRSPRAATWLLVLAHFLWQGAVVGVVYGLVRRATGSASRRYLAGVACVGVMGACPLVTYVWLTSASQGVASVPDVVRDVTSWAPADEAQADNALARLANDNEWLHRMPDLAAEVLELGTAGVPPREVRGIKESVPLAHATEWTAITRPWLLAGWLLGVLVLLLRLSIGNLMLMRVRRSRVPLDAQLTVRAHRLARRLKVPGRVVVAGSHRVATAVASGLLRPIVLLPCAWMMELSPDVLDAVIAHELAHIRRRDLWVDLMQRLVETLLFYHPVVWWISNCVRHEREKCCDAEAARAVQSRVEYARALELLAAKRLLAAVPHGSVAGIGENDMRILDRVRHVLGTTARRRSGGMWPLGLLIVGTLTALTAAWPTLNLRAATDMGEPADDSAQEDVEFPDQLDREPHEPEWVERDDNANRRDREGDRDRDRDLDRRERRFDTRDDDLRERLQRMEGTLLAQSRRLEELERQNQAYRAALEATQRQLQRANQLLQHRPLAESENPMPAPRGDTPPRAQFRGDDRPDYRPWRVDPEDEYGERAEMRPRQPQLERYAGEREEAPVIAREQHRARRRELIEARARDVRQTLAQLDAEFELQAQHAAEQRDRERKRLQRRRDLRQQQMAMQQALREVQLTRKRLQQHSQRQRLEAELEKLTAVASAEEGPSRVALDVEMKQLRAELEKLAAEEELVQKELELQAMAEKLQLEAEMQEIDDQMAQQSDKELDLLRRRIDEKRRSLELTLQKLEGERAQLQKNAPGRDAHRDRGGFGLEAPDHHDDQHNGDHDHDHDHDGDHDDDHNHHYGDTDENEHHEGGS